MPFTIWNSSYSNVFFSKEIFKKPKNSHLRSFNFLQTLIFHQKYRYVHTQTKFLLKKLIWPSISHWKTFLFSSLSCSSSPRKHFTRTKALFHAFKIQKVLRVSDFRIETSMLQHLCEISFTIVCMLD